MNESILSTDPKVGVKMVETFMNDVAKGDYEYIVIALPINSRSVHCITSIEGSSLIEALEWIASEYKDETFSIPETKVQ